MLKAAVLSTVMTLTSPLIGAKAPHCDGMELSGEQARVPAQQEVHFPKLENYLDMNCYQLNDKNSQDEFIVFFRKEMKALNSDICSIVKDEDDQLSSQAERKNIGLGTFSKMVEVHFNDFIYEKKLNHYQDLDCQSLMNTKSNDSFVRYFAENMKSEGINLCQDGGEFMMDDDRSQAEMPIGRGTISKLVELHFEQFTYSR